MIESKTGVNIENASLVNVDGKVLEKVYDDVLHKPMNLIGRAINAKLANFEAWVIESEYNAKQKLEAISNLTSEKLSEIEKEKIIDPEPYIAIPAIQAMTYSMDSEELRNMFSSLLASSMNSDTKDYVHPAFVEIIKQLNPFDAKVLNSIKLESNSGKIKSLPCFSVRVQEEDKSNSKKYYDNESSPFVMFVETHGFNVYECVPYSENLNSLSDLAKFNVSIDNASRLGILSNSSYYHTSFKYSSLESLPIFNHILSHCNQIIDANNLDYEITCHPKSIQLTNFGANFIKTCIL